MVHIFFICSYFVVRCAESGPTTTEVTPGQPNPMEQETISALETLSLDQAAVLEKGTKLLDQENKTVSSNKGAAVGKGDTSAVDWNGVADETKIKLSKWGDQYMEGIRAEVIYNFIS